MTTNNTPGKIIRKGKGTSGTTYRLRFHTGSSGPMGLYVGRGSDAISVGDVADAENFETAVDVADEEMRCLLADAQAEFA